MTIAISLKVNDGLVLAADSATTLISKTPSGETRVGHIYYSACKIFNVIRGRPIGVMTWGSGSIGTSSISTLCKDLRRRFEDRSAEDKKWHVDADDYSIERIAQLVREFMYDELYEPFFADWDEKPSLSFIVGGYSTGADMAEEYQINIEKGKCTDAFEARPKSECGMTWGGETEAIHRVVLGYGKRLGEVLETRLKVPESQIKPAMETISQNLFVPLITPPMPIQDAIDLAGFLVDLTIKFSQFSPGAQTVGGPIEIAAITKHEGFKWVRRKHYYHADLNPEVYDELRLSELLSRHIKD